MKTILLENGVTAIAHSVPNLKNAVVNTLYRIGSAHEDAHQTGLAHFLEHMMFEGTRNYPDFDSVLQSMMGENNAFTTQDYTVYYETVPTMHLEEILKIEADRMTNISLQKQSVENQISVILEEFKETSMNPPLADSWHYLLKLCFKNSYQWPVIGKELDHIRTITPAIIRLFYKKHYVPKNVIVSIVSELSEEQALQLVHNQFSGIKSPKDSPCIPLHTPKDKKTGKRRLKRKNIASPHFFLAFHIADFGTKDYFIADMVSDILTNGESSILYQSLVHQKKLCSEINSYTSDNQYCNVLTIEGKLFPHVTFEEVYTEIQNQFQRLISKGVSSLQFDTAMNKALTYWAFYHYNTQQLVQNMAIFHSCMGVHDPIAFISDIYSSIDRFEIDVFIKPFLDIHRCSVLEYQPF